VDRLRLVATEIALLPLAQKKAFLRDLFSNISSKEKAKLFETVAYLTQPTERWKEVGLWMERRFIKDMKRTPYRVAMMCLNYTKTDRKMKPLFIKLARQAKDRVRKRLEYDSNKDKRR
jgi:hypothetical protein